jgi:methionine biosynthesis protein MetW
MTMSRADMKQIVAWIPPGSRVLDVGCGDGRLLAHLQRETGCAGYGIEIDEAKIWGCVENGVSVIHCDAHDGLALFPDRSFDVVVLSQALQMLRSAEKLMREVSRVAGSGIASFPNFGYWRHVWSISRGRMPMSRQMPYPWYDTPNIHHCTMHDFEMLVQGMGLHVTQRVLLNDDRQVRWLGGLRSTCAVYRLVW